MYQKITLDHKHVKKAQENLTYVDWMKVEKLAQVIMPQKFIYKPKELILLYKNKHMSSCIQILQDFISF
jgi:hypothetical protein